MALGGEGIFLATFSCFPCHPQTCSTPQGWRSLSLNQNSPEKGVALSTRDARV